MNDNFKQLSEYDIENKVQSDVKYIQGEIIAKQVDGNYCKWSRVLKAITVIGFSQKQYMDYWKKQYKNYSQYMPLIVSTCNDKFANGLVSSQELMELIHNSQDFESEKVRAITALGGSNKNGK